ncbi:MAG: HipA domain-containing protein, partial [Candidatus Binatia bacterium]
AILRDRRIKWPIGWTGFAAVETARDVFVGYLMFDAWIANQDRHHENWGLIVTPDATHLAPSYDHASSLGSGETDANRADRLTTHDKQRSVERYVEKGESAFYALSSSKKALSILEAFREAGKLKPQAADAWLERLRQVSLQDVACIFDQIPPERITLVTSRFAQKMLEVNRQRLLALQGVWS